MKTIKSKRTKINTKLLLAALATAFTLANPMTSITAHADLVDETNEWKIQILKVLKALLFCLFNIYSYT